MSENQIKEDIEKIGYKEFYRYYKEKDILLHQQQIELDQYKNNWEELKKYIGEEWYCFDNESLEFEIAKSILNKMKELEEKINE